MTSASPFPNPPIREALLDIQCELESSIDLAKLADFQIQIAQRFPIKEERISWAGGLKIEKGAPPQMLDPKYDVEGYMFKSSDKKKIVQARLNGFTFNQLKPYDRWETFSAEAKELWGRYLEIAKPKKITRLALRYINRIELPLPLKDLGEYLLTMPKVGEGVSIKPSTFFARLELPYAEIGAIAIITETIEKAEANMLPLIFDIDAIKTVSMDPNSGEVWTIMENLRDFKNRIFKNSLTEKAKELFQ